MNYAEFLDGLIVFGLYPPQSGGGSGTVTNVGTGTGLTGGPITGSGVISLATIASMNLLANLTGGAAAPIPHTMSAIFDSVFDNTQGDILYRNATVWTVLSPGSTGQVLVSGGASGNPSWAGGTGGTVTEVDTGSGLTGGPITSSGTISFAEIADSLLLSNISGISAVPTANTLTAILDHVIDNTQGDLLYRNGTVWTFLAPGTVGQVLTTGGTAANPAWATGGTGTVTNVITGTGLTGGPITTTGTIALAPIATLNLLANLTGVSAAPTPSTISTIFDSVFDNTQGDILYRSATGWTYLTPGTAGTFLKTGGVSANPSWAAAPGGTVTSVATGTGLTGGTITGAGTVSFANIASGFVLANISGVSAPPTANTLTAVFDSVFGSTQGQILYRNASAWTPLAPGTANQVLTTHGSAANPTWTTPSGSAFAYQKSLWVSQANGSNSNSGTSINTPLLTIQAAITIASTTPTMIYVVDANLNNLETLTYPASCQIGISAPGTAFNGTQSIGSGGTVWINGLLTAGIITLSSSAQLSLSLINQAGQINCTGANFLYVTANSIFNPHSTGTNNNITIETTSLFDFNFGAGDTVSVVCSAIGGTLINAATLYIDCPSLATSTITNTGTINGKLEGTNYGVLGIAAAGSSAASYFFPVVDGTSDQVLQTDGSGNVTWQTGGGGSSFSYVQTFWVSQQNGDDSNAGTSIDTPLLTVQAAITLAANTPTMIYVVDYANNSETITTLGTAQVLSINAPGTSFNDSITVTSPDQFTITAYGINVMTNNSAAGTVVNVTNGQLVTYNELGTSYITAPIFNILNQGGATTTFCYMNVQFSGTYNVDGTNGSLLYLTSSNSASVNLINGAELFISSPVNATITDDSTCPVSGMAGSVLYPGGYNMSIANTYGVVQYELPNADGAANQVITADGFGGSSWATPPASSNFQYITTYWVSQANGSNSNTGLSIEEPKLTIGAAIAAGGSNNMIIYVVDANATNSETLSLSGSGSSVYIDAPGTTFTATSTCSLNGNTLYLNCVDIAGISNFSGTLHLNANIVSGLVDVGITYVNCVEIDSLDQGIFSSPGAITTINCDIATGSWTQQNTLNLTCSGSNTASIAVNGNLAVLNSWGVLGNVTTGSSTIVCNIDVTDAGTMTVATTDTMNINALHAVALVNSGTLNANVGICPTVTNTGNIVGFINNIAFGNFGVTGTTQSVAAYNLPVVDGTAGQFLQTDGATNVTWQNGGGGSGFAYVQALWVSQNNGNDANVGTSIDTPLLTVQHAINLAADTPTMIYVVDAFVNNEALTTDNSGQFFFIDAPGTQFNASITVLNNDEIFINAASVNMFTNSGQVNANNGLGISTLTNTGGFYGLVFFADQTPTLFGIGVGIGSQLDSIAAYTLPVVDGSASQFLQTNGSGVVTWQNGAGGGVSGDFIFSNVNYAGSISLTNNTPADVTSITLPAGDWDVYGNVYFNCTGGTALNCYGWTNTVSATVPDPSMICEIAGVLDNSNQGLECPFLRVNVGAPTTVYLTGQAAFSSGAATVCGSIFARRSVTFNGNIGDATGSSLTFTPGQGIVGITNGTAMGAGYVGETITVNVPSGSAVTLNPSGQVTDIASLPLTAGNWNIYSNINIDGMGTSNLYAGWWSSTTSATIPDGSLISQITDAGMITNMQWGGPTPLLQVNTAGTPTVYLSVYASYVLGPFTVCGTITAVRYS